MDDFVNRQVYWHLQLRVRHTSEMTKYMYIEFFYSREYLQRNCIRGQECVYGREYWRRNCEWKYVEIMSDDRRLSDVSRGNNVLI